MIHFNHHGIMICGIVICSPEMNIMKIKEQTVDVMYPSGRNSTAN